MAAQLINQAGFAAHRGVSRKTVTHWKHKGLLVLSDDGEVDVRASDQMLLDHGISFPKVTETAVSADTTGPETEWSKAEAERIKENYTARLKQLEYERESERVALVDDVAAMVADEYEVVRQRLGRLPAELAPKLAALTSAEQIKAAIDAAVVDALTELTMINNT